MKFNDILEKLRVIFVTTEIFEIKIKNLSDRVTPLEKIIYGGIGLALSILLTAIIYTVVRNKS